MLMEFRLLCQRSLSILVENLDQWLGAIISDNSTTDYSLIKIEKVTKKSFFLFVLIIGVIIWATTVLRVIFFVVIVVVFVMTIRVLWVFICVILRRTFDDFVKFTPVKPNTSALRTIIYFMSSIFSFAETLRLNIIIWFSCAMIKNE